MSIIQNARGVWGGGGRDRGGDDGGNAQRIKVTRTPGVTISSMAMFVYQLIELTCKGTLRQVFIRVFRLEIQSIMLIFSTKLCELLPL